MDLYLSASPKLLRTAAFLADFSQNQRIKTRILGDSEIGLTVVVFRFSVKWRRRSPGNRYIVNWDLRESMTEADIEIILERAKEMHPEAGPRIISDNGPQFI